jgi:hypothetical protein
MQLCRLDISKLILQLPTSAGSTDSRGSIGSLAAVASAVVLPQLRELGLTQCQLTTQLLLQLLSPTSLTKVQWNNVVVYNEDWSEPLTQRHVLATVWQRLQLLPKLSELHMAEMAMASADIAPLSNLQHLQHLRLKFSTVDHAATARELLLALQHLTQLQHLQLEDFKLHSVKSQPQEQEDSHQCLSALTASTQLTALVLSDFGGMPVPQAAFEHMFPVGHVLPNLKMLHIVNWSPRYGSCVQAPQIVRIAASCTALQELTLQGVTPEGFTKNALNVSCLSQLPHSVKRVQGLVWYR